MTSSNIRFLGLSSAVLAIAVGVALYLVPEFASSSPTQPTPVTDTHDDPAPQRFQVAQASGQTTVAATGSSLPGGASSLNETYKDWRVACVQDGNAKRCALSQVQVQENGQRVLAIELNALSVNTVSGTLVLPFGLALEPGVTFQIDDKQAMQPVHFRTCVPAGCLVSVTFDTPTLVALRAGAALKVKAVADGGAAAPFSISLQGFGTALDRVETLAR
ncbi:invasion associated locus B family protein (plasmid) [Ensifer adhaerens]|uniref:invasion associated locus B family protein n=1 Tax=Ensifer adhaerens TaxID=106592 RepID=UPI0023A9D544|nr:invasion associated locus B family protein [Ensifer adhaerens]WDZ80294.1 invasion associated locus B family protein [Ensifer adhaerens]